MLYSTEKTVVFVCLLVRSFVSLFVLSLVVRVLLFWLILGKWRMSENILDVQVI